MDGWMDYIKCIRFMTPTSPSLYEVVRWETVHDRTAMSGDQDITLREGRQSPHSHGNINTRRPQGYFIYSDLHNIQNFIMFHYS